MQVQGCATMYFWLKSCHNALLTTTVLPSWFLLFVLPIISVIYYPQGIQKALPDNERCLITIAYADGPDVPRGLAPLLRSRPSELDRMPYVIAGCCADVHFLVNISKTAAELTLVGNFVF